jgi:alkylation response protein AidB-like acyl-CoA dehydrogenase
MYDLTLTPEQLEFRDTVRDFVEAEVKPAALSPKRLEPFEKPLLADVLEKASHMGLRALALSEAAGGAGADGVTACIVLEELGAGDVDVATVLARTATLAPALFDRLMSPEQRARYLPKFVSDERFHLAYAGPAPAAGIGWSYHRPLPAEAGAEPVAVKKGNEWVINGAVAFVANAPVAKLFAVQVRTDPKKSGLSTLLVPREAPGLAVREPLRAVGESIRWHHGAGAGVTFKDCRVPADHLLGEEGRSPLAKGAEHARGAPALAAVNLGLGRAAHEAAVDYAKIRRQGGRNIVEHQAIGTKLADCAIKLELARNAVWKAAWALDHPDAVANRSVPELPLHVVARVCTAEAVNDVALLSAECFGAMGVMRDMPLQKYVHDAMVFLHSEDADGAAKLAIAEALAGYTRPLAA